MRDRTAPTDGDAQRFVVESLTRQVLAADARARRLTRVLHEALRYRWVAGPGQAATAMDRLRAEAAEVVAAPQLSVTIALRE